MDGGGKFDSKNKIKVYNGQEMVESYDHQETQHIKADAYAYDLLY